MLGFPLYIPEKKTALVQSSANIIFNWKNRLSSINTISSLFRGIFQRGLQRILLANLYVCCTENCNFGQMKNTVA
ncbi:hypothetical protein HZS_8168 [Henneguya salminicola]|nr:hypothetical protein HZS_8168 [Henneguya salminicola]